MAEQEPIEENPINLSTPKIDNIMTTFNNILSEQTTYASTVTSGETRTITNTEKWFLNNEKCYVNFFCWKWFNTQVGPYLQVLRYNMCHITSVTTITIPTSIGNTIEHKTIRIVPAVIAQDSSKTVRKK
jgi:hypothetical protein